MAYTFSKTINNTPDNAIDSAAAADIFNRGLERSIANFNYPQFLKLTWIYDLPIGPGKLINVPGFWGKLVGGWNLTGIHQFRSGDPLSIGVARAVNPLGARGRIMSSGSRSSRTVPPPSPSAALRAAQPI